MSARGMHLVDHAAPALQRGFAIEVWHLGIESGGGMWRIGSFGDDQSHAAFCAAPIIGGNVGARYAAGGKGSRHGRHDDAVGKGESDERKGRE